MPLFLDTGRISEIEKYMRLGVIRGVTTNPTILLKDGVTGGVEGIRRRAVEIAGIIRPYPFSVEVTTNDKDEMIRQALAFSKWADNVTVKITIHGPDGEPENLEVVNILENKYNVRINVTAMMSAQQCLLAALAGASYVSIFGGRVNNMGYDSRVEIKRLRGLIDSFGLKARIIVGSTREVLNVIEWLEAGAHIVTVAPDLIKGMLVHPYSKETIRMFLDDAMKTEAVIRHESLKGGRPSMV
jgi:transaldolase